MHSQILISLDEIEQIADELMNAAKDIDDRGDVFHEGFKSGFGLGVSSVVRKIKVGRNDSKRTNRTEPDDN